MKNMAIYSLTLFLLLGCSTLKFGFFSDLVVASLKDFQGKVAQIMKAVGLALDDFDFVVHPFQLAGVDGVVTVV